MVLLSIMQSREHSNDRAGDSATLIGSGILMVSTMLIAGVVLRVAMIVAQSRSASL